MTACEVTASVGNAQPVVALVQSVTGVVASVAPVPAAVASVASVTSVNAAVSNAQPVAASVQVDARVEALVKKLQGVIAEFQVAGLTGTLLDKLNSIPWGGCDQPVTLKKLSSTSMRGTESGDYDPFPGANVLRDVNVWRVNHPLWRGEGIVQVRMTGSFVHTSGSGDTFTIELQVADVFPTLPETPVVDRGMPQAFATVFSVTSKPLGEDASEQTWVLSLDIISEGTTNNQFHQVVTGYLEHSDPSAPDGLVHMRITPTRIAIDTTKSFFMKPQFKTDYTVAGGDHFRVLSSSAALKLQRDT